MNTLPTLQDLASNKKALTVISDLIAGLRQIPDTRAERSASLSFTVWPTFLRKQARVYGLIPGQRTDFMTTEMLELIFGSELRINYSSKATSKSDTGHTRYFTHPTAERLIYWSKLSQKHPELNTIQDVRLARVLDLCEADIMSAGFCSDDAERSRMLIPIVGIRRKGCIEYVEAEGHEGGRLYSYLNMAPRKFKELFAKHKADVYDVQVVNVDMKCSHFALLLDGCSEPARRAYVHLKSFVEHPEYIKDVEGFGVKGTEGMLQSLLYSDKSGAMKHHSAFARGARFLGMTSEAAWHKLRNLKLNINDAMVDQGITGVDWPSKLARHLIQAERKFMDGYKQRAEALGCSFEPDFDGCQLSIPKHLNIDAVLKQLDTHSIVSMREKPFIKGGTSRWCGDEEDIADIKSLHCINKFARVDSLIEDALSHSSRTHLSFQLQHRLARIERHLSE